MPISKELIRTVIDKACQKTGLTFCGLADYLGVAHASIYRWYNGQEPSLSNFIALLKIADIRDLGQLWR